MTSNLRVVVADDEGPARRFLVDLLAVCGGVDVVGEAANGREAVTLIGERRPDLALLDLQMPEIGGLDVVRHLAAEQVPLVAFVTAFDEFAVEAFELNALDYLLKPVVQARLEETLERARRRRTAESPLLTRSRVDAAHEHLAGRASPYLERIPVRHRGDVIFVPVRRLASVVADGELLQLTTLSNERYTLTHRLHLLEDRLDPRRFLRLSRSALINLDALVKASPMPGGTFVAVLSNGQQLAVSRQHSRVLRDTLMKL